MKKKMLVVSLFAGLALLGSAINNVQEANAWSLNLANGQVQFNDFFTVDVVFDGLESDGLSSLDVSVYFDTSILSPLTSNTVTGENYTVIDTAPPFGEKTVWEGQPLPASSLDNVVYSIFGSTPFGSTDLFYPELQGANTQLNQIWFNIDDQAEFANIIDYTDLVDFGMNPLGPDSILANGHGYSFTGTGVGIDLTMAISADGQSLAPSAVPIPGAVWLLGSGLAGMVAMRRKKNS